ncbi:type II and III secretion system protein family protein [Vibrio navarrensis]
MNFQTICRTFFVLLVASGLPSQTLAAGLILAQGDATSIVTDQAIGTVFVSAPNVADYQILDTNKLVLFGIERGDSRVMVFGKNNQKIYEQKISVVRDVSLVNRQLALRYPGLNLRVEAIDQQVLVSGEVIDVGQHFDVIELVGELLKLEKLEQKKSQADERGTRAMDIVEVAAEFNRRVEYRGLVDQLRVAQSDQINVKLSIAEVSRQLNEELGFKWATKGQSFGQFMLTNFKAADLSTLIGALDDNTLGQMLAEPNLSVLSGESAAFLVGGELPIVTSSANGSSVTYKEYGIKLAFAAKSMESGRIRLKLKPEVSSVDQGYRTQNDFMPALRTRKAETTLELEDGESFVIGGLLSSEDVEGLSKIPGAGDIPILGSLFRNASTKREKRELVIVATVNRVKGQHASEIQLPAIQTSSTYQRFFGVESAPQHAATQQLLSEGGFKK